MASGRDQRTELVGLLGEAIPEDHARQVSLGEMVEAELHGSKRKLRILDLGCGDGKAVDQLRSLGIDFEYIGLDIGDSPEVRSRVRDDVRFITFDGVTIPLPSEEFDFVLSHQVLEHVRDLDGLMREVARVLRPAGMFLASASFLEPYHSYSLFNISPYGAFSLLRSAGLEVPWIRPGIDGVTLILRASVPSLKTKLNRFFAGSSPFYRYIKFRDRRTSSIREINASQLAVAGHIVFAGRKPL